MLTVSNLTISSVEGKYLLKDVSLSLDQDERICLTGASGAGKSTLIRVIMGIGGNGLSVLSGDVQLDGKSILNLTTRERRDLCGKTFGFIPQNSMTAFFSNIKIGRQISETYQGRLQLSRKEAYQLARETLEKSQSKGCRQSSERLSEPAFRWNAAKNSDVHDFRHEAKIYPRR